MIFANTENINVVELLESDILLLNSLIMLSTCLFVLIIVNVSFSQQTKRNISEVKIYNRRDISLSKEENDNIPRELLEKEISTRNKK